MSNSAQPQVSAEFAECDPPAVEFAPWPYFSNAQVEAVAGVLQSGQVNYWTGTGGREFEANYASYCGVEYAVALANGSLALEAALYGLGIGPGDDVIVTPRSFVASASCVVLVGATPVFADVDPDSQNITAETIEAALTERTKAIIVVHLAGWPCDMHAIMTLARRHGLKVIEDCAQAHGARYADQPVGSFGDVGTFSFCQDKIISTGGEGGLLVTDDQAVWERVWSFKDHGKDYTRITTEPAGHGLGFRWVHDSIGTNWRMTEMQAVIGSQQLAQLPDWVATRRRFAATLSDCFERLPALRVTRPAANVFHAFYKYYVFVRPERLRDGWSRDRILAEINAAGVPCKSGSCAEIYLERAFDAPGLRPERRLPVAQALGTTSLMFMVHPTLSDLAIAHTAAVVKRVIDEASR